MQSTQTFQDLIMKLNSFWASKGCLIGQPYNQVVGAGTMNPATFLRVLGPEPWNVAYTEPSVRPDDGRFGQNPNRLFTHTQYQVILKPSPERSQELYLESLKAIGVDLSKHDVRFVEDNWAQPAIGAWGLGWEVWLDGLEITQYTYFQQVGGVSLDPICLEITYGLERIAMALQNTRSVFELQWDATRTYGDVKLQDEIERSQYAFNYADVEDMHELFEIYERECKRTLGYGLVLPAYDYVLQCSNLFNLLDTRGAVGVTERARFLGRIRDLAREVAIKYTEQRAALGHPWLVKSAESLVLSPQSVNSSTQPASPPHLLTPSALLIELGVEELPADNVPTTQEQLRKLIEDTLKGERIEHGGITMYATPRRIAAVIADVAPQQRGLDELMKGPSAKVAFDAAGNPTQAALGFAKRFGVDAKELIVKEEGNASYVYARKQEVGKPTGEVLSKALPGLIGKLSFEKTMRWNASNVAFSRPINWIVALLGNSVIPFEFASVHSGRNSTGPRGEGSPRFDIAHANAYAATIKNYGIIGDIATRKAEILKQVQAVAASVGGVISEDEDLLEEVTHLVEQPAALLSSFEKEYLDIPAPVLISVLRKKQRNFTVLAADSPLPSDGGGLGGGSMLPYFITVRNGRATDLDEVRTGNESVVRARFADAAYFVRQDVQQPLEKYLPRLDTITFQGKLGSILDKVKRIESVIDPLGHQLRLASSDLEIARKAAHLCKADLATNMVIDITALQGTMGREYHKRSGEDADKNAVAEAIYEHYLPRNSNDRAPKTKAGLLVGLADKLDSIAGLFAVGLAPKGSNDPFALRRAAIGVVQNLMETEQSFSLREGLKSVAARLPVKMEAAALDLAHTFLTERERVILEESGNGKDLVEAVLAEQNDNPAQAKTALAQLVATTQTPEWPAMLVAYARCARIVRSASSPISGNATQDPDASTQQLLKSVDTLTPPHSVETLMQNIATLVSPINTFFDKVMVMADDPTIRGARLALLQRIVEQARGLVDLSKIEGF